MVLLLRSQIGLARSDFELRATGLRNKDQEGKKKGRCVSVIMQKLKLFALDSPWLPKSEIERFELFWGAYPKRNGRRVGKKAAYERFMVLSEQDKLAAIQAAQHYADSLTPNGSSFVPYARDPERFLKNDYWREYLEPTTHPCKWRSGCDRTAGESGYCTKHWAEKQRYDAVRALRGIRQPSA